MHDQEKREGSAYPTGRGYGHDYLRGGEVFGGYGYSDRPGYERRRGELENASPPDAEQSQSKEQ